MSYKIDRFRVVQVTPQYDVELPIIKLEEYGGNLLSYGVLYEFKLEAIHHAKEMSTTLTEEELVMLRDAIDNLLRLRAEDPQRQKLELK